MWQLPLDMVVYSEEWHHHTMNRRTALFALIVVGLGSVAGVCFHSWCKYLVAVLPDLGPGSLRRGLMLMDLKLASVFIGGAVCLFAVMASGRWGSRSGRGPGG